MFETVLIWVEWVSGDLEAVAQWEYGSNDEIAYHKVWKQKQSPFNEIGDRAEWGNIVSIGVTLYGGS